ncbi:MAG TPA: hypothetical protein DEP84_26800 [Chloroflexi bacterium]|nr:hypothetical protein [Chloroflexota bacterium]
MELCFSADSSWNRWHPTYEELGQLCQRYDINGLELVYYPDNDGFWEAAETLAGYGVRIVCVNATAKWRPMLEDDPSKSQAQINRCINLATETGAKYVIHYPGFNARWDFKETRDQYRRRLEPCLELAAETGITLLLENHFDLRNEDPHKRDPVREPDLTALFMSALDAPQVRINYDPGNLYCAGIEPWPYAYRTLKDFIVYAHLKGIGRFSEGIYGSIRDSETLSDSHTGTYIPVAIGDGGINYWSLLQEMERDNAVECATFEDHARPEARERILSRGVRLARQAIAAVRDEARGEDGR